MDDVRRLGTLLLTVILSAFLTKLVETRLKGDLVHTLLITIMVASLFMFGASLNRKKRSNTVFCKVVATVTVPLLLSMQLSHLNLIIMNHWFAYLNMRSFYINMLYIFYNYLFVDQEATIFGFSFGKTMEEVERELDAGKDIQLIDVRKTSEYRDGYIPGTNHLALSGLGDRAAAAVAKRKPHYPYCRGEQHFRTALKRLQALGYDELYNIGGIVYWPHEQKTGGQR